MKTFQEIPEIKTRGFNDCLDITSTVEDILHKSQIITGTATIFIPGATAALTTIEYEPGVIKDLQNTIEKIAPENAPYHHDQRWHDGNGFSHIRAALIGPSLSIPVHNGKLVLGTWQQIILIDFDNRPRKRKYTVSIMGI